MAQITMKAITEKDAIGRPVFDTGVSTIGLKGDDFICGHCGRTMMSNFDISRMQLKMAYKCGGCGGLNAPGRR